MMYPPALCSGMWMFNLLGFGEHAGSGVPDICSIWEQAGYVEPNIEEFFGNTETNEPDKTIVTLSLVEKNHALFSEEHEKGHEKGHDVNARAEAALRIIHENHCVKLADIASSLGITLKQARFAIDLLKSTNRIQRDGSARNGKWIIIE